MRVFIVHGWGGTNKKEFFPWLRKELRKKGFEAYAPAMPDSLHPKIKVWINYLSKQIKKPDEDTILVGHSIGGQTILRYLAQEKGGYKIRGVVLLASWVRLKRASYETKEDYSIANPWLSTPINWQNVLTHTRNITAIASDNDPYIPRNSAEVFRKNLHAKVIIEHNKGHYNEEVGTKEAPTLLKEIVRISKL